MRVIDELKYLRKAVEDKNDFVTRYQDPNDWSSYDETIADLNSTIAVYAELVIESIYGDRE